MIEPLGRQGLATAGQHCPLMTRSPGTWAGILKNQANFTMAMGYCRGTKGYIIEIGDTADGPWTKVAEGELPIPVRDVPVDITHLPLSKPQTARFVRFRCVSWWNNGCLLGYIRAVSL